MRMFARIVALGLAVVAFSTLAADQKEILGKWETVKDGNTTAIEFKADGTGTATEHGNTLQHTYKFDTTKTPHHLDIKLTDPAGEKIELQWIVAFEGADKMKIGNNRFEENGTRPTAFTDKNSGVFTRK